MHFETEFWGISGGLLGTTPYSFREQRIRLTSSLERLFNFSAYCDAAC